MNSFIYKLNECVSYTNAATSIFVCHVCVYPVYKYIYILYLQFSDLISCCFIPTKNNINTYYYSKHCIDKK